MSKDSKEKSVRNRASKFSKQEVDLTKAPLFFPEGFEKLFIAIYFVTLPYIAGLLFQYLYLADAKLEVFLTLYENSMFILIWAIGYEIIATFILLYILKLAISSISFQNNKHNGRFNKDFRIP